jgi:predicted  nucleic acid-binding Zn-ribbon protein
MVAEEMASLREKLEHAINRLAAVEGTARGLMEQRETTEAEIRRLRAQVARLQGEVRAILDQLRRDHARGNSRGKKKPPHPSG